LHMKIAKDKLFSRLKIIYVNMWILVIYIAPNMKNDIYQFGKPIGDP
jgi:hypothetical protein